MADTGFSEETAAPVDAVGETRYARWASRFITAFATLVALFLVINVSGFLEARGIRFMPEQTRGVGLGAILILSFLLPSGSRRVSKSVRWHDLLFIAIGLAPVLYMIFFYDRILDRLMKGSAGTIEIVLSLCITIALAEATRRRLGLIPAVLIVLFFIHPVVSNHLPGILHGRGYPLSRVAYENYVGDHGVFGSILGIAVTLVFIFIVFGQFLQTTGATNWFMRIALSVTAGRTGGPAKAAVVASALFGTVSGASTANVATTGVVTIPLMKSTGYTPAFSGGVEAAASTGGQIMPPVMGAVAFIIADWLGISYWEVCVAAILPALLYFTSIFVMVHQEARRLHLPVTSKALAPPVLKVLREGVYWLLPLALIVVVLGVWHYPAQRAGFYGLVLLVVLSMFKKETRLTPRKVVEGLRDGMVSVLPAGIACAMVGILVGSLSLTGIGIKLSGYLVDWTGGNMIALAVLAALASYVLGMGLPAVPAYIMVVTLVAPALIKLGVLPLAAHLFVFYWAMLSFITPPVAVAAYVAGSIAEANPIHCAVHASRIALIAYVVPFVFLLDPRLLFEGPVWEVIGVGVLTAIGTIGLSCGALGYLAEKTNWLARAVLIIGSLLLVFPTGNYATRVIGGGLLAVVFAPQLLLVLRKRKASAAQ